MANDKNSNVFVNDDGTLGFVGAEVHFTAPGAGDGTPVYLWGSLILLNDITVARPVDRKTGLSDYRALASPVSAMSSSSATFSLAGTASLATSGTGSMRAPPFLVLEALKKDPSAYPLYDTLNALIEAVLQLNRRGA